ncbi:MAG: Uncharacterised protein [Bacteroidota bacterium]|nr:MAG: Uncharacterised protein [Bacteroidota bacterium]
MFQGVLTKMKTEWQSPVNYYLLFQDSFIHVNSLLQKKVQISLTGYECLSCHAPKEIFRQGFCKSCFFETPSAGEWIMKPELSKAHLGIEDRDLAFEQKVQLQPHIVYFAVSSGLKVGVTRKTQVPTRWIDQGAHQALPIVEVPNRYLAGITEVALKAYFNDKTNWRVMLQNKGEQLDLVAERAACLSKLPAEVQPYIASDASIEVAYPVQRFPEKVKSLTLSKSPEYTGILKGIKGQYWIFEDDTVWNVRGHEGHVVSIAVD